MAIETVGSASLWAGFTVFIIFMLILDLGVFHRKAKKISMKDASLWTCIWIAFALAFNGLIYYWFGSKIALEFTTGYLIEKALSVDNIFIFLVVFSYFKVRPSLQHRVLFWGILGAIVFRLIFILLGGVLLQKFHWMMYVFGVFLVFTGIKLLINKDEEIEPEKNLALRLFRMVVPVSRYFKGEKFFIREKGKLLATPLFMVLVVIEATDVIFAIDSIPAIFAITSDPFIVYTSNIFAILGLRSMYFLLAGVMEKFHYIKVGLALVLVFVGIKMSITDFYTIPIWASLLVIVTLIGGSIVYSLCHPQETKESD